MSRIPGLYTLSNKEVRGTEVRYKSRSDANRRRTPAVSAEMLTRDLEIIQIYVTKHLTPPRAYLALGKTPKARQEKYRQLCDEYLREAGLIKDDPAEEMEALFIGATLWQETRRTTLRTSQQARAAPS